MPDNEDRFVGEAAAIRPLTLISSEDKTSPASKLAMLNVKRILAGEAPEEAPQSKLDAVASKLDTVSRRIDSLG